jgi:hypothetical protein
LNGLPHIRQRISEKVDPSLLTFWNFGRSLDGRKS